MGEIARKLTPRQRSILDAALRRFSHYGYRRTSMDEIAREAELSRTALYQHFGNKEEIFRALAAYLYQRALAAAGAASRMEGEIEGRIFRVLDAKMGFFYELLHGSEHGLEILDEGNRLCGDVTAAASSRYKRILVGVIRDGESRGELSLLRVGLAADGAAQLLVDCAEGLARGRGVPPAPGQYRARLRQLVGALVTGFGSKAPIPQRRRDRAKRRSLSRSNRGGPPG